MSSSGQMPRGWLEVPFDNAVEVVSDRGLRIKQKHYLEAGTVPVVDQGEGIVGGYTDQVEARIDSPLPVFVFGDHTRRFKYISFPFAVGADGVKLFAPERFWESRFLFHQLETIDLENRGYGRHYQYLRKESLLLPPLAEQTRIVEKLEELLSDLDAGVAELKAAQRKLAQYRQSLLKAAVEGALTANWRAARAQSGEPEETGATLLQRILTDRRTRWETKQLAKFAEQGKTPPKGWQSKYPEPVAPDTADLPVLPEGWVWTSVDQLTEFVTSGSRGWADYYADRGATFIRSHNINKDWLDLSDIAFVDPPKNSEGARTRIKRNDLLLTITGANVGKSAWVNVELEEAYVSQHVALIRPVESDISAYLHLFLTCKAGGRGQLDREAYGAGKPGLNLQQILSVVVPLPSPRELPELLSAVASIIDAATTQETSIAHALQQSATQRKNILKAAFAGQLVPQDPSDEPVSALLERICAERDNPKHASTRSRRTKQPKRPVEPDA